MSDRIQEIRARVEAASPAPWYSDGWGVIDEDTGEIIELHDTHPDAKFIAHARQDIPYLLDLVESIQRETEPVPLTESDEIKNAFFAMVIAERSEQDRKWGYPQLNTLCEWASYLAEECGESIKELNDLNFGKGSKEKLVDELTQTAAMCLAILQQYDTAVDITKKKRDYLYTTEPKGEPHD